MKRSISVLVLVLICLPASAQEKKPGFTVIQENPTVAKAMFTIDGKVRVDGKTRDLVVGEGFEFEKPNLQSKWNPDPISPADVGWSYLVRQAWRNGDLCVQPRFISSEGTLTLGRAFVVKSHPTIKDTKARTLIGMDGKWRLAGTTKNEKTGAMFFVLEVIDYKKK